MNMTANSLTPELSEYTAAVTGPSAESVIMDNLELVDRVLGKMLRQLPPTLDIEELRSVGRLGLVAAAQNYRSSDRNTFVGYAALRIRGAILDELRRWDMLPRSARAKARKLKAAVEELEQDFGRTPSDEEICHHIKISPQHLRQLQHQTQAMQVVSIDAPPSSEGEYEMGGGLHDVIPDHSQPRCNERLERQELIEELQQRIYRLPDRQRKVLAMYYYEGLKLAEIALAFEVTEARICQLHAQALRNLKQSMQACAA